MWADMECALSEPKWAHLVLFPLEVSDGEWVPLGD